MPRVPCAWKSPRFKPVKPYPERIGQSVRTAGSAAEDAVTAAPAVCRSCGATRHEGARFCDACGSQLVSVDAAEYKQVTVLFADVVGSMDIAAVLDMERLRDIMTDFVEPCGGGGAALRRDRGVHRRWGDGTVRGPGGVGGSCFSGVPGRAEHPKGDNPVGGGCAAPRRGGSSSSGGSEFGPGDRRGDRRGVVGLSRDRRAGRVWRNAWSRWRRRAG